MDLMRTTHVTQHSHSSLSARHHPFQPHTFKSLSVGTGCDVDPLADTVVTRTFHLSKRIISKELISLNTLKRKSSSMFRRILSLDGDAYRPKPQADVEIESESDDDATLVADIPPFEKKSEYYESFTDVEQLPPVMLGKKIYDHLSGYSNKEDDDSSQISSHDGLISKATSSTINTPSPPSSPRRIRLFSPRNDLGSGFEVVKEDTRIVYATALSPPPWHRPNESMLIYEFAGPDDDPKS